MRLVLLVKTVHVLAAILFLGTGLGSAYYKLVADRSGNIEVVVWCQRAVVRADWLFTVPSGIVLPLSGLWMVYLYNLSLTAPWILVGIAFYLVAGFTWLPAAWIQLRMRAMAEAALDGAEPLPPEFLRYHRVWLGLGFPSFFAAMFTIWVMIDKSLHF